MNDRYHSQGLRPTALCKYSFTSNHSCERQHTVSNLRGKAKHVFLFNKKDLRAERVIILEAEMTVF